MGREYNSFWKMVLACKGQEEDDIGIGRYNIKYSPNVGENIRLFGAPYQRTTSWVFSQLSIFEERYFDTDVSKRVGFDIEPYINTIGKGLVKYNMELYKLTTKENTPYDSICGELVAPVHDAESVVEDAVSSILDDFIRWVNNPSPGQQVAKSILNSIISQNDPNNRFVVDTICTYNENTKLYDISVVSNCDGWAEDTIKIGEWYEPISLNDMTEKMAMEKLDWRMVIRYQLQKLVEIGRLGDLTDDGDQWWEVPEEYKEFLERLNGNLCCLMTTQSYSATKLKELNSVLPEKLTLWAGDSDSFGWLTACGTYAGGSLFIC